MSFLKEFKTFAMRGNVVDMAVGIIIGGAFGKIVSSLVSDIIMPPIGLLIGGVKFESLKIVLKHAHTDAVSDTTPCTVLTFWGTAGAAVFGAVLIRITSSSKRQVK